MRQILEIQRSGKLDSRFDQLLQSKNPTTRYRLCLASANSRDTSLVPQLIPLTADASATVRRGAAFALGQLNCRSAQSLLLKRVDLETNDTVREQLILSLSKIGGSPELNMLLQRFGNHPVFNSALLRGLIYFFNRDIINAAAVAYCGQQLSSQHGEHRRLAAYALSRKIPDHFLSEIQQQTLTDALRSDDPEVRRIAVKLNPPNTREEYLQLLSDPAWLVRYETAKLAAQATEDQISWKEVLRDKNPHVVGILLKNLPPESGEHPMLRKQLDSLFVTGTPHIKGLIVQLLASQYGPQSIAKTAIKAGDKNLQPYYVTGLARHITPPSLIELQKLSSATSPAIATTAYRGALTVVGQLYASGAVSIQDLQSIVASGLFSNDPVQQILALDTVLETAIDFSGIVDSLYIYFEYPRKPLQIDAAFLLMEVIKRYPTDRARQLLMDLSQHQEHDLRRRVHEILQRTYGIQKSIIPIQIDRASTAPGLEVLAHHGLQPRIKFTTTKGSFVIECDGFYAPYTTATFLKLIKSGFYNGLTFHRVIPDFVVQGGDPRGDGWGGPGYRLLTEKSPLEYDTGSVGMANSGPDTEGSQFFIVTTPQYHLDYNYTRFGEVVSGMDVVHSIERGNRILSARIVN